jgi:hypothetical protein
MTAGDRGWRKERYPLNVILSMIARNKTGRRQPCAQNSQPQAILGRSQAGNPGTYRAIPHDWAFWSYHNTSDIAPTAITGDMHSINRANFAILHWFGLKLAPRLTHRQAQLKHLYCGNAIGDYQECLLQPAGQIDRQLIAAEKANIDRIVATLGLKDMSQATLIRKLCALSQHNQTRKAIFEFDKLIRSIYTLNYLRDPQLQRDIHRSQNRIEAYHQLRSALTQVSGGKQLLGRTDLAVAISNQCGRLIANIIIAYNSILLSTLLERYQGATIEKRLRCCGRSSRWLGSTSTCLDTTRFAAMGTRSTLKPCWPMSNWAK